MESHGAGWVYEYQGWTADTKLYHWHAARAKPGKNSSMRHRTVHRLSETRTNIQAVMNR
jgi:hypothetical protein